MLKLNDGSEEELRYSTLTQSEDHALYCRVRQAGLSARLIPKAYLQLAERIEARGDGFVLLAAGAEHPISMG